MINMQCKHRQKESCYTSPTEEEYQKDDTKEIIHERGSRRIMQNFSGNPILGIRNSANSWKYKTASCIRELKAEKRLENSK